MCFILFSCLASCPDEARNGGDGGASGRPAASPAPPGSAVPVAWPIIDLNPKALEAESDRIKRMLGADFTARVASPFVVCGDISEASMDRIVTHTVGDYSKALCADFFDKTQPSHVIRILLFKDDESYRRNAIDLFGYDPRTPYGYYDSKIKTLVMNISTGGGTLVHEMVHAFKNYDFPGAPAWFDEGLASLFEQCTLRDGRITGLVNWRLRVFDDEFRKGNAISLADLIGLADSEFRGAGSSLHYAEARYFCMFLQERGLLRKFYREFRDRFPEDGTGGKFVAELFGKPVGEVEKEWLDWVGTLKW